MDRKTAREAFLALAPFATFDDAWTAALDEAEPPACPMCDSLGCPSYACTLELDERYRAEVEEDELRVGGRL